MPKGDLSLVIIENIISPLIPIFDELIENYNGIQIQSYFEKVRNPLYINSSKLSNSKGIKKSQKKYYWWPMSINKKNKWRSLYPKIRPLKDKGMTNTEIAEKFGLNRHDISRIITWYFESSEAHGK